MPRANVVQFRAQSVNHEPTERLSDHSIVGPDGTRFTLGQVANSQNWYAFWPGPKRRQRQSLRCRDFEQAKHALHQWVMEYFRPKQATPETVMIAQVLDAYHKAVDARPASTSSHPATTKRTVILMLEWWGDAKVALLEDRSEQVRFIQYLASDQGPNYAVATICKAMGVLSAALHLARDELGMLKHFPRVITGKTAIAKITRKSAAKPSLRWLSIPELAAFMDAITARHVWRYCILALSTAARPDAICDLERSSVLWDDGVIRLNPPGREQTKKVRPTIPLVPTLAGWLKVWGREDRPGSRFYVHQKGHRVENPKKAFRLVAERAGLITPADYLPSGKIRPDRAITPYTLRRTVATYLRGNDIASDDIGGLMGHRVTSEPCSTEAYLYMTPEEQARVSKALEVMFDKLAAATKAAPIRASDVAPKSVPTHRRHRVYGQ